MRTPLLIALLSGAALATDDWVSLEAEWDAAVARYDAAVQRAGSDSARARIKHPFGEYRARLRRCATHLANTPQALPCLTALIAHTDDKDEQLWIMVQLRENHLRQPELVETIPGMVRIGSDEALRTLREMAESSPDEAVRMRARGGVRELTVLQVGKSAPTTTGRDENDKPLGLREHRGRVALLLFVPSQGDPRLKEMRRLVTRLKDRPFAILGAGSAGEKWRSWADPKPMQAAWNALDGPRTILIDQRGAIAHKDLWGRELEEAARKLIAAVDEDS